MSKKLIFILVLVSLLAAMLTTASAAPVGITKVTLLEAVYLREKGVTFKFRIEGKFNQKRLPGTVTFDGKVANLRCNVNDGLVVCTAPKATAKYAGARGYVTLAGFSFPVVIPARVHADVNTE
jgi:riboflavin synthase alpha subunit